MKFDFDTWYIAAIGVAALIVAGHKATVRKRRKNRRVRYQQGQQEIIERLKNSKNRGRA